MTEISIEGTRFFVNGQPTYAGISYEGKPVEGLLFNSRMVQAVYDDDNPQTVARWCYPDTGPEYGRVLLSVARVPAARAVGGNSGSAGRRFDI